MTLTDPKLTEITSFSSFCTDFDVFVTGTDRDYKFGTQVDHSKSQPADKKSSLKGAWLG